VQGFRKVSPDRWEFAHADFLAGQRHLLANIRRQRGAAGVGYRAAKTGSGGREKELEKLRREREALARELTMLRREQQEARAQLRDVERRVQGTERWQEQCAAAFLARAALDPASETSRKRRRLDADATPGVADLLAFVELALAGGAEAESASIQAVESAQGAGAATSLDMVWNELLGEEPVAIDAKADHRGGAAVEPWVEMGEDEVTELVDLASP
jgi:heat shock transcription factor